MPTEAVHVAQAKRNHQAIEYLNKAPDGFPEWVAMAAFYTALHVVEAVFSNDAAVGHTQTHEMRERMLKTTKKYQHIYMHYAVLKRVSLIARYLCADGGHEYGSFANFMSSEMVRSEILNHRLRQVQRSALNFLSPEAKPELEPGASPANSSVARDSE